MTIEEVPCTKEEWEKQQKENLISQSILNTVIESALCIKPTKLSQKIFGLEPNKLERGLMNSIKKPV